MKVRLYLRRGLWSIAAIIGCAVVALYRSLPCMIGPFVLVKERECATGTSFTASPSRAGMGALKMINSRRVERLTPVDRLIAELLFERK